MKYSSKKVGHRLVFAPDKDMQDALDWKLGLLKRSYPVNSPVSVFGKKDGLRVLLSRHSESRGRFFLIVDFCHAFHHIKRQTITKLIPKIGEPTFDICFVELAGEEVIPAGFSTSSYLFELFMSKGIDPKLVAWQKEHNGLVTRYVDNILFTWRKNTKEAFRDLQRIFKGFSIRMTPRDPREWKEPIRFCGTILPPRGRPKISKRKKKKMIGKAISKSQASLEGVMRFVDQFT